MPSLSKTGQSHVKLDKTFYPPNPGFKTFHVFFMTFFLKKWRQISKDVRSSRRQTFRRPQNFKILRTSERRQTFESFGIRGARHLWRCLMKTCTSINQVPQNKSLAGRHLQYDGRRQNITGPSCHSAIWIWCQVAWCHNGCAKLTWRNGWLGVKLMQAPNGQWRQKHSLHKEVQFNLLNNKSAKDLQNIYGKNIIRELHYLTPVSFVHYAPCVFNLTSRWKCRLFMISPFTLCFVMAMLCYIGQFCSQPQYNISI